VQARQARTELDERQRDFAAAEGAFRRELALHEQVNDSLKAQVAELEGMREKLDAAAAELRQQLRQQEQVRRWGEL
jgi:DNA repair exonuclease SbcCD ATPase subunit